MLAAAAFVAMLAAVAALCVAASVALYTIGALRRIEREQRKRDEIARRRALALRLGVDERTERILSELAQIADSSEGIADMLVAWDQWWAKSEKIWAARHASAIEHKDAHGATIATGAQCDIVRTRQAIQAQTEDR